MEQQLFAMPIEHAELIDPTPTTVIPLPTPTTIPLSTDTTTTTTTASLLRLSSSPTLHSEAITATSSAYSVTSDTVPTAESDIPTSVELPPEIPTVSSSSEVAAATVQQNLGLPTSTRETLITNNRSK